MPDEQLVQFTIVFEDKASDALRNAQGVFDVASSSFEKGMTGVVESMQGFDSSANTLGSFLAGAPAQISTASAGLISLTTGFENATKAVGELDASSGFLEKLPQGDLVVGFQDKDAKELGVGMGKGFVENLKKEDFAGTLSDSMGNAVLTASMEASGKKKKDEFLAGAGGGASTEAMGKSMSKAFAPLTGLAKLLKGGVSKTGLLETLLGIGGILTIAKLFAPMVEILADLFTALLTPVQELGVAFAISLIPLFNSLGKTIGKFTSWLFPKIISLMTDYIVPAIQSVFKWVVDLAKLAWPILTNFISSYVIPAFMWLGGELKKLYDEYMPKLQEAVVWVGQELVKLYDKYLPKVIEAWNIFRDTLVELYNEYMPKLEKFVNENIVPAIQWMGEEFAKLGDWIGNHFTEVVLGALIIGLGVLVYWLGTVAVAVIAATWPILAIGAAIAGVILIAQNWGAITDWLSKKWGDFVDWLSDKILSFINMAPDWGKSLAMSFVNGILSVGDWAKQKIKDFTGWIRSFFPGSDAEQGPLSDISSMGPGLVKTFAEGITKSRPVAVQATQRLMEDTHSELTAEPPRPGGQSVVDTSQPIVAAIEALSRVVRDAVMLIDKTQTDLHVRRELSMTTGFSG